MSNLFLYGMGVASLINRKRKEPKEDPTMRQGYYNKLGFNHPRQDHLNHILIYGHPSYQKTRPNNYWFRMEVARNLGRELTKEEWNDKGTKERVMREIARKEGWRYYDYDELMADPVYRAYCGLPYRPPMMGSKFYPEKVLLSDSEINEVYEEARSQTALICDSYTQSEVVVVMGIVFSMWVSVMLLDNSETSMGGVILGCLSCIGMIITNVVHKKKRDAELSYELPHAEPIPSNPEIVCDGEQCSLRAWAVKTGIPLKVLYERIVVNRWECGKAFAMPVTDEEYKRAGLNKVATVENTVCELKSDTPVQTTQLISYQGEQLTLKEWSDLTGIPPKILYERIVVNQWDCGKAFATPVTDEEYKKAGLQN